MVSILNSSSAPLKPGADLVAYLNQWVRPAVVDYDAEARTELSGRVLANWAAKTANLIEEMGLAEGDRAVVDLPVNWSSLAALLGVAWADLELIYASETPDQTDIDAELVITTRPDIWEDHPAELLVLGASSPEDGTSELPNHAVNYDDEVAAQPDQCVLDVPDIVAATAPEQTPETPTQMLFPGRGVVVFSHRLSMDATLFGNAVQQWSKQQPVVLWAPDVDSEPGAESEAVRHMISSENLNSPA